MARSRIMFMFVPMCRYEGYAGHDRRNSMAAANGLSSEHALKIAIVCNRTMQSLRCLHGSLFRNIGKAQQQRTPRIDLERVTGKRCEGEALALSETDQFSIGNAAGRMQQQVRATTAL
jgi:hypothetical protein